MESIDALAKAVNEFEGGLVLVSHDMRLISQVAKEIWICDNRTITSYKGDIMNFKMDMRSQMGIDDAGGKLRGDASVKAADKAKASAPKKPEPKLEVVRPKAPVIATIAEKEQSPTPVSLPASPTAPPATDAPADDDATAVTTATGNSGSTLTSSSNNGDAPKRYIPPHLRKKMALEQQQQ